jgi:hypothetical protein
MRKIFLSFCLSSLAPIPNLGVQPLNQQLSDRSTIEVEGDNGRLVKFTVAEAKDIFQKLWLGLDPSLPSNARFPQALKDKLSWAKERAIIVYDPSFPPDWTDEINLSKGGGGTMAKADYCTFPQANIYGKPCIIVMVSLLTLDMKMIQNLTAPNEMFRNYFAVIMGHEAIHLENTHEQMREKAKSKPTAEQEELRAWRRMMADYITPMRQSKMAMRKELLQSHDLFLACKGQFPCKGFDSQVRISAKVPKRPG